MTDDSEERDETLGAALRQLDVPPPREDFYPRLLARLEAESAPNLRRRWKVGSPMWVGAAAAVLVVVLVTSWVGLPGGRSKRLLGPNPAEAITADQLRARVDAALASLQTLAGELSEHRPSDPTAPPSVLGAFEGPPPERYRFALTSAGDFRVDGLHDNSVTAYSTERGTQRSFSTAAGSTTLAAELTGLAPGPPDPAPGPTALSRSLGSLVRTFLRSDADVPVTEATFDGRPAWNLVVPLKFAGRTLGELDVTVDQQTGFPLQVIQITIPRSGERVVMRELRVSNLVVDGRLPSNTFVPPYPPGTPPVSSFDRGYHRVSLREVAGAVGYAPLVPQQVPAGFKLTEVAVSISGAPTGPDNPPSRNVVSLAWQRGFDRFVVTMRATGPDRTRWQNPFRAVDPRAGDAPEPLTIATGSAAGGAGQIGVGAGVGQHAWAVTDRLVVTASGDLTREELIQVLGSLQAAR